MQIFVFVSNDMRTITQTFDCVMYDTYMYKGIRFVSYRTVSLEHIYML